MNKTIVALVAVITLFTMTSVSAKIAHKEERWCPMPYVGADAEWRHLNFKKGSGDNLFDHDYPQGNVYVGVKINQFVGVEAGYEATTRKTRVSTLGPGSTIASFFVGAGGPTVQYYSQGRVKGPHLDLVVFLPISETYRLQLVGMVGVARLKAQFTRRTVIVDGRPATTGLVYSNFTQKRSVLRLGGGLQHMLNERWGIRALLKWENTNKMNNIRDVNSTTSFLANKNSLIYSLGLFLEF